MRTIKKLVSLVLAGAMVLAMSVGTFATTGISPEEQKILDEAHTKAVELGVNTEKSGMYKEYISQASTYLAKNELSKTQIDAMVKAIDDAAATAKAFMQSKGVSRLGELSQEDFNKLFEQVGDQIVVAAKAVGIVVKKTADGYEVEDLLPNKKVDNDTKEEDKKDTLVDNRKPDTYMQTTSVVKQTGAELAVDQTELSAASMDTAVNMAPAVVWGVMLVGAVAVCGVVAKKKKLFSGAEA